jgi:protein-S-isoprenylcysteine O-methyltransferase Ste14
MGFVQKRLRPRLILLYLLALAVLLLADPSPAGLLIGGVLVGAGEAVRIWATGHLNKNDDLTITGPYRFLRHPLYLGSLLIGCGFATMGSNRVTLVLLAVFLAVFLGYYMPYKERIESARLEELYGEAFRRYATAVPKLLPRFYPYVALGSVKDVSAGWRMERFIDNNELGTGLTAGLGILAMVARWSLA